MSFTFWQFSIKTVICTEQVNGADYQYVTHRHNKGALSTVEHYRVLKHTLSDTLSILSSFIAHRQQTHTHANIWTACKPSTSCSTARQSPTSSSTCMTTVCRTDILHMHKTYTTHVQNKKNIHRFSLICEIKKKHNINTRWYLHLCLSAHTQTFTSPKMKPQSRTEIWTRGNNSWWYNKLPYLLLTLQTWCFFWEQWWLKWHRRINALCHSAIKGSIYFALSHSPVVVVHAVICGAHVSWFRPSSAKSEYLEYTGRSLWKDLVE